MSLLRQCLETSLIDSVLDPTGIPILENRNWSSHYRGRGHLYEDWRPRALAMLQNIKHKPTFLDVIDTASFFLYFVGPLVRSYAAYKREIESTLAKEPARAEADTEIEPVDSHGDGNTPELSSDVWAKMEDLGDDLHHFYVGLFIWRDYYGRGFVKKALRREEYLNLKHTYPRSAAGIMVVDSD